MGMKVRSKAPLEVSFPFFGAGDATYFEWAEIHVCFARAPSAAERKAIAQKVPLPLQDSVEFKGQHLMAASGQFAHAAMAEAYEGSADPKDESQWDSGRWFFASSEQVDAFNQHTEEWLREAHAICPILAVYRREDYESGGTNLSPWHKESMKQVEDVLASISALTKSASSAKRLEYMREGIASFC
jgi:hypothetical protein